MTEQPQTEHKGERDEFLRAAADKDRGIVREFVAFMAENKVWWMAPILVVLGIVAVLLVITATPVGAFLYPFF